MNAKSCLFTADNCDENPFSWSMRCSTSALLSTTISCSSVAIDLTRPAKNVELERKSCLRGSEDGFVASWLDELKNRSNAAVRLLDSDPTKFRMRFA